MKTHFKQWLRPAFYAFLRWSVRAQGSLWDRGIPPIKNQLGLDLGCGPRKRLGFIGIDRHLSPGVDVICDLERGALPFACDVFDIVYASQVLEHIVDLQNVLAETSRVMKPGAKLQVGVPYAGSLRAFQDPTHVRYFTLKTFEYFVTEGSRVGGWYLSKHFRRISRRHLVFGSGPLSLLMGLTMNRSLGLLDLYEASLLRMVPARDLHVELEK
jgi:SAM-dependent methyltransferase